MVYSNFTENTFNLTSKSVSLGFDCPPGNKIINVQAGNFILIVRNYI